MIKITEKQLEYLINAKGKELRDMIANPTIAPSIFINDLQDELSELRGKFPKKNTPVSETQEPAINN